MEWTALLWPPGQRRSIRKGGPAMKAPSVKPVRRAIYTRVSTEHGLDQEFNSLDAQYDAASARSASIRNNLDPSPTSRITLARKIAIAAANAVGIRARARLPGTEFLDAETERQKSPLKRATVRRDRSLGIGCSAIARGRRWL